MGKLLQVPTALIPLAELALLDNREPTKHEWKTWVLLSDAVYVDDTVKSCDNNCTCAIRVPPGFMTDFASIPWMFRWWQTGSTGPQRVAAYFHDWLYSSQSEYNRKESDRIFREVMHAAGGGWFRRWAMYAALRVGGFMAWRSNQRNYREQGHHWRMLRN